jgi:hypothetical protein
VVTAREGLPVYSSLGAIVCTFPYGARVVVLERKQKDAIDEITDCWYRIFMPLWEERGVWHYVFGAPFSETVPADVIPIIGSWSRVEGTASAVGWWFNSEGRAGQNYGRQCGGWEGNWSYSDGIITLSDWRAHSFEGASGNPKEVTIKTEFIGAKISSYCAIETMISGKKYI